MLGFKFNMKSPPKSGEIKVTIVKNGFQNNYEERLENSAWQLSKKCPQCGYVKPDKIDAKHPNKPKPRIPSMLTVTEFGNIWSTYCTSCDNCKCEYEVNYKK